MNLPRREFVRWLPGWALALLSGRAAAQQRGRGKGGPGNNQGSGRGQGGSGAQGRGGSGQKGGAGRDDADHRTIQILMQNRNNSAGRSRIFLTACAP